MRDAVTDMIGRFYKAYNAQDAVAATALYETDALHREVASGHQRKGHAALLEGLQRFFTLVPNAHWLLRERIDAGAFVSVVYTMTGHLGLDLKGRSTRGRAISIAGIHVFEIIDLRLVSTSDHWDPTTFERQIRDGAI